MNKLQFLAYRITHMDYRQFFDTIGKAHRMSGRNRAYLFFDIIYCGIKYQAGYIDYVNCGMYDLNRSERSDVITSGVNNQYVIKYNDPAYTHLFINKSEFGKKFAKYLNRDWLIVDGKDKRDDFARFIEGKRDLIIKPVEGTGGSGVAEFPAEMKSFDKNLGSIPYIAEEKIEQSAEMSALYPGSVNTVRAVTFLTKDGPVLLAAYLRIGQDGIVDNFCSGGMLTPVDLESGEIRYPAVDESNTAYSVHPVTGASIVGFKVPMWEKVKAVALEAANVVPQVRYVGWDIALTDSGPCLIEGNEYPGHVFYVFSQHHPDHQGMRHVFEAVMD